MKAIIHKHGDDERNVVALTINACHFDERLSWKAVGLLHYLLSHPADWDFYRQDLINRHTDGKSAVVSGLRELREFGYLRTERSQEETGHFDGYVWHISDLPLSEDEWRERVLPEAEKADAGKQETTGGGKTVRRKSGTHRELPNNSSLKGDSDSNEPPPIENPSLFEAEDPKEFALEVGRFCERLELKWTIKTPIADWCRQIAREPAYAGVDFAFEVRKATDWHDSNGKKGGKADLKLRTWLGNASKYKREEVDKRREAEGAESDGPSWLENIREDFGLE